MQHLQRSVCWLGAFAFLAWGCAAVLVGFQMAGDIPGPLGGFIGLIAVALTNAAIQIARRETPAKEYVPAPLAVVVAEPPRTRPTAPVALNGPPTVQLPRQTGWTGTYTSTHSTPRAVNGARVGLAAAEAERRSQDYWDGVHDCAETLFEERDDDPPQRP